MVGVAVFAIIGYAVALFFACLCGYLISWSNWYAEQDRFHMGSKEIDYAAGAILALVLTLAIFVVTTCVVYVEYHNEYTHVGDSRTKLTLIWARDKPENVRNGLRKALADKVLTVNELYDIYRIDNYNEHVSLGDDIDHFKYVEE